MQKAHSPEPCLLTDQNFTNNSQKQSPKKHSCGIISNLIGSFREEDFLRISSCPYSAKSSPPFGSHVFRQIKISRTIFEKSHPRNNPMKLFQNLTAVSEEKNFSEVHTAKKASPPWQPCFQRIKISRTIFEKGHTRNNLVKLFQILTSSFREDFLRISSCPFIAKSLSSPSTQGVHFFDRTKFHNQFLKRVTRGTIL